MLEFRHNFYGKLYHQAVARGGGFNEVLVSKTNLTESVKYDRQFCEQFYYIIVKISIYKIFKTYNKSYI